MAQQPAKEPTHFIMTLTTCSDGRRLPATSNWSDVTCDDCLKSLPAVHWCGATDGCNGGRNDTGDWQQVTCKACLVSQPAASKPACHGCEHRESGRPGSNDRCLASDSRRIAYAPGSTSPAWCPRRAKPSTVELATDPYAAAMLAKIEDLTRLVEANDTRVESLAAANAELTRKLDLATADDRDDVSDLLARVTKLESMRADLMTSSEANDLKRDLKRIKNHVMPTLTSRLTKLESFDLKLLQQMQRSNTARLDSYQPGSFNGLIESLTKRANAQDITAEALEVSIDRLSAKMVNSDAANQRLADLDLVDLDHDSRLKKLEGNYVGVIGERNQLAAAAKLDAKDRERINDLEAAMVNKLDVRRYSANVAIVDSSFRQLIEARDLAVKRVNDLEAAFNRVNSCVADFEAWRASLTTNNVAPDLVEELKRTDADVAKLGAHVADLTSWRGRIDQMVTNTIDEMNAVMKANEASFDLRSTSANQRLADLDLVVGAIEEAVNALAADVARLEDAPTQAQLECLTLDLNDRFKAVFDHVERLDGNADGVDQHISQIDDRIAKVDRKRRKLKRNTTTAVQVLVERMLLAEAAIKRIDIDDDHGRTFAEETRVMAEQCASGPWVESQLATVRARLAVIDDNIKSTNAYTEENRKMMNCTISGPWVKRQLDKLERSTEGQGNLLAKYGDQLAELKRRTKLNHDDVTTVAMAQNGLIEWREDLDGIDSFDGLDARDLLAELLTVTRQGDSVCLKRIDGFAERLDACQQLTNTELERLAETIDQLCQVQNRDAERNQANSDKESRQAALTRAEIERLNRLTDANARDIEFVGCMVEVATPASSTSDQSPPVAEAVISACRQWLADPHRYTDRCVEQFERKLKEALGDSK